MNRLAATRRVMRGRFACLLVLVALFFGVVAMPAIAHASGHSAVHSAEVLDAHGWDDAGHSESQDGGKDMPCHAVSHHHCSVALELDSPRIDATGLTKAVLGQPTATASLSSRSQAPPLDPPNA